MFWDFNELLPRCQTAVALMCNCQRRTKTCACMYWKQESCNKTNIGTSKYSRLPSTNKDFTLSSEHMHNRIRTQEQTPVTSLLVLVSLQGPPSAVGPLRLNSEACGEGGRWGGQMGTQYTSSSKTQKLPIPEKDSGEVGWGISWRSTHPPLAAHEQKKSPWLI